ncbi:hypothetical protein ACPZ19_43790 [Amycolatopsis lurida]
MFAVACGERTVRSLSAGAELAFARDDVAGTAEILTDALGMVMRSLDRLLRQADASARDAVFAAMTQVLGKVSGRVLGSVREHLANRAESDAARVFTTRSRRAWVTDDTRPALRGEIITQACALIDAELTARLPRPERLVSDPAVLSVALPLSGKATEADHLAFHHGHEDPSPAPTGQRHRAAGSPLGDAPGLRLPLRNGAGPRTRHAAVRGEHPVRVRAQRARRGDRDTDHRAGPGDGQRWSAWMPIIGGKRIRPMAAAVPAVIDTIGYTNDAGRRSRWCASPRPAFEVGGNCVNATGCAPIEGCGPEHPGHGDGPTATG